MTACSRLFRALVFTAFLLLLAGPAQARERWSEAQAKAWASQQPFLTGGNFLPSNAINQLEMWRRRASTPSPSTASSAGPRGWG